MADEQQSAEEGATPPAKNDRPPSYPQLIEERQHLKEAIGRQLAETEERIATLVATVTSMTEEQRATLATMQDASEADREQQRKLTGALEALVATLTAPTSSPAAVTDETEVTTAGAGNGGDEAALPVAEDDADTSGLSAGTDDAAGEEEVAAGEEEAGSEAGTPGGEEEPATAAEAREDGEEPGEDDAAAGEETGDDGCAPAGDGSAPEDAAGGAPGQPSATPSPDAIVRALAEKLPLAAIQASVEAIRVALARDGKEDEAKPGPDLDSVIEVLSALRSDLDDLSELIQTLHRSPPPGKAPAALSADEAVKFHAEIMEHIDQLIVRIAETLPGGEGEEAETGRQEAESTRPPPTGLDEVRTAAADLSTQLRAEGGAFRRFAWIFAGLAAAALPMAVALGIFVQREYTLMPAPPETDPTAGWKDIVWNDYGNAIAECRAMQNAGVGECVITITPPAH